MTAKEYLSRYRWQNDRINAKLEQVAELRRKAQTVCSGSSDGSHSSTPYDRIGEITARIVDLEREINEDIDRSIDTQRSILSAISAIPDDPTFKNSIITMVEIDEKTWVRLIKNKKVLYKHE